MIYFDNQQTARLFDDPEAAPLSPAERAERVRRAHSTLHHQMDALLAMWIASAQLPYTTPEARKDIEKMVDDYHAAQFQLMHNVRQSAEIAHEESAPSGSADLAEGAAANAEAYLRDTALLYNEIMAIVRAALDVFTLDAQRAAADLYTAMERPLVKMTIDEVKRDLPPVIVRLDNGAYERGKLSGRENNFATVTIATGAHYAYAWQTVTQAVNNGSALTT